MQITCSYCGSIADLPKGAVNRAKRVGANIYCNRVCSGLGRRKGKTKAQKIEEKRLYDAQYRGKNRSMLKEKKHKWFKET